MIIDHLGIAVKDLQKSILHWVDVFGYNQLTEITLNTKQKVNVVFLTKPNSLTIKLIEPSEESSTLNSFLNKSSNGLHHICFKTDNLELKVKELKQNGMFLVSAPESGEAFDNELIAFLINKDNLRIELIDTDKKANLKSQF